MLSKLGEEISTSNDDSRSTSSDDSRSGDTTVEVPLDVPVD